MNRITKINIAIFTLLSAVTLLVNILKYKGTGNLAIIFMVLTFNLSLSLLLIPTAGHIVKISKKGFRLFLFYLILVTFFYWYLISTLLHWYYGSFISLGGLYYFIATRTYQSSILIYVGSGLLILISSLVLLYFTRRYVFEDLPKRKMSNKLKLLLILTPLIILILVLNIVPKENFYQASPAIEIIAQYTLAGLPTGLIPGNYSYAEGTKLFNQSLDLENPNVIVILLESISSEHLPIYGYERNITPNLDKFSEKAIVFEKAYSTSAHSDYAQTSFLSGRYTLTDEYRTFFDQNYPREFIWDTLKNQGNYTTAYFSSQDDNWAHMIRYYNKETLDVYNYSMSDNNYDYGGGNARKDYDEHTIKDAIAWINQTQENNKPFFLYTNLQATHYPYEYPENNSIFTPDQVSFETSYFSIASGDYEPSVNAYDNSIYYVDKQVGKLLDFLENNTLLNNTVIIISADHGETLERKHGLRHGFGVYEEEVVVPLLIYIPNQEPRTIKERVRNIDTIPTILDILGFNLSEQFQGQPMKTNQNIFLTTQNQNFILGIIKDDIKYILNMITLIPEAYNLTADPNEQNNLITNTKEERYFYFTYGYILNKWYHCQVDYYENERWKDGDVIDC